MSRAKRTVVVRNGKTNLAGGRARTELLARGLRELSPEERFTDRLLESGRRRAEHESFLRRSKQ